MESSPEGYAVSCHYRPAGSGEHGEHTNRYGRLHGTASLCVSNDLDHQRCTVAEVGDVSFFSKKMTSISSWIPFFTRGSAMERTTRLLSAMEEG